ncbi:DUF2103 domain-containing protein [Sphaerobacter sp.]|uniref:DUF2103 domain-containing protein n=1 Tax=Sphaerobacter sp. TaxID=2099654 RepID=UPI001DC2D721|nr:DUF2103 domain-containing protein [Sphaerobacter sp.]MBX5444463.1 hypothetical protein [Sphaerobacter sp.]
MRYRDGILKIEHGILPGLKEVLLQLTEVEDVRSIVPGRIYATRGRPGGALSVRVSAPTATGVKLIARRGSSVQEVFVVCDDRAAVEQVLREAGVHPRRTQGR